MANRYWGLSRRQTIVTFALVVVIGIGIGLVLGPGGADDGSSAPSDRTGRIRPGTPASPRAVWAFGFETLRFDPDLGLRGRLPVQGFGTVQGSAGRVDLYDPASGRTGILTSATNRLRSTGRVTAGVAPTAPFAPLVATTVTHRWLVPRPGEVRGLAAAADGVFTLADNGASLVRIDGTAPQVVLRILETPPPTFRLPASLSVSGSRVYALVPRAAATNDRRARLVGYDAGRGRPTRAVDLPSALFAGAVAAT